MKPIAIAMIVKRYCIPVLPRSVEKNASEDWLSRDDAFPVSIEAK